MKKSKEKWIAWNPDNKLSGYYQKVSFLASDEEGIKIAYMDEEDPKKIMNVLFQRGGFGGYRCTNESYMSQIQHLCASESSLVYKVVNSNYIAWLSQISDDLSSFMLPNLQHFVFVSSDDYIEVLCDCDPEIIFETLS